MNHRTIFTAARFCAAFGAATLGADLASAAPPLVFAAGQETVALSIGNALDAGTPQNIAFDPTLGRYYGGTGGSTNDSAYVWDATGQLVQAFHPINIDLRAMNFNPVTGGIEAVTFDARSGNGSGALMALARDADGLFTSTMATPLLASMPGVIDEQSAPVYDPARHAFYSLGTQSDPALAGHVNVVSRTNGALVGQIKLDLAAAGSPTLQGEFIGFDPAVQALIGMTADRTQAMVFSSRDGSFLGASTLPSFSTESIPEGFGYGNGHLFVFDSAQREYRGFDVINTAAVPEPSDFALLALGLPLLAEARRRVRAAGDA